MATSSTDPIYIPYSGPSLLGVSLLNKGTAFTEQERHEFNLAGLSPHRFETLEQQAERAYLQYQSFETAINKHIYLRNIQDTNETLFYYLLSQHLQEMMPIIYTPTVGEACQRFSEIYRRARGVFLSYPDRHQLDDILHNVTKHHVRVIVVTDGSRILGLGDQGVGGMGIPIGKLSLYTACAGISPAYTLPIQLDVGTNNKALLNDPMYIGWQHPRIDDEQYDEFIEMFIQAVTKRWPAAMIQFEDFEQKKALPLLQRYQQRICCFNDDIQGTAAVTVGTLIAACTAIGSRLSEQRIVFAGAGSAGCGIAEQIIQQMCAEGLTEQAARERIFMVDKLGLLRQDMTGLPAFQQRLAQPAERVAQWPKHDNIILLYTVVEQVRPTILIGVSGQAGLFDESLVKTMYQYCPRPIILPLSNPSHCVEALPQDLVDWTQGNAIIATGSPFPAVQFQGKQVAIAQCNNSYIFPGIGLATVMVGIKRITNEMMMIASQVLAEQSPLLQDKLAALLPPLTQSLQLSQQIALAVAAYAREQGIASNQDEPLQQALQRHVWQPHYRSYRRSSV